MNRKIPETTVFATEQQVVDIEETTEYIEKELTAFLLN